MFGHVEGPRVVGAAPAARRASSSAERRLHRVRAAPVRAHGGADRACKGQARRGPTFGEVLLAPRRRAARAPPVVHERPGVVGEARARRAFARRSRAGVNDLGGTLMNESISRAAGRAARPGAAAGADGGADPLRRPHAEAADDALRRVPPERAACVVRRRAARRAAEPAGARGGAGSAAAPRAAGARRSRALSYAPHVWSRGVQLGEPSAGRPRLCARCPASSPERPFDAAGPWIAFAVSDDAGAPGW